MKQYISNNNELNEILVNNGINLICNEEMRVIISDEDAERIPVIVEQLAPAASQDYSLIEPEYIVRFERLNADDGELKTFKTLKEAVNFCEATAKGEEKATGESDKYPQIRWYVIPSIYDETEGPEELYSTDWFWWRGI